MGPILNALIKLQVLRIAYVLSSPNSPDAGEPSSFRKPVAPQSGLEAKKEEIKMTRVQADRWNLSWSSATRISPG